MATFDAFRFIDLLARRPLLIVLGAEAVTEHIGTEAFANALEPKDLRWIDGASHVSLYRNPEHLRPALEKLTSFVEPQLARATMASELTASKLSGRAGPSS